MPILTAPWIKPLGLNYKTAAEAIRAGNITVALDGHNGAPSAFKGAMSSIIARQGIKKAVTSLYGISAITIAPYFSGSNLILPRQYAAFGGEVVELFDPTTLGDLTYPLGALADGGYMLKMELFGALVGASTSSQTIPTGLAGITDTTNKPGVNTLFGNGNIAAASIGTVFDSPFVGGSTVQQQKYVQLQYKITLAPENNLVGLATTIDPAINYAADATLSPWGVSATLASDSVVPESISRAFVIARMDKLGSVYTVQAPLAIGATIPSRQNHAQVASSLPYTAQRLSLLEARTLDTEARITKSDGGLMLNTGSSKAWKLCSFPVGATPTNCSAIIEVETITDRTTYVVSLIGVTASVRAFNIGGNNKAGVSVYADLDGTIGIYYITGVLGDINPQRYRVWGKNILPSGKTAVENGTISAPDLFGFSIVGLTGAPLASSSSGLVGLQPLQQSVDNHDTRIISLEQSTRFYWLRDSPSGTGDPAEYIENVASDLGAGVPDETAQKTVGAIAGGGVDYVLPGLSLVPTGATRIAVFVEIFSFEYDWQALYLGNVADVRTLRPVAVAARNAGIDMRTVFNYTADQISGGTVTPFQPVNISATKTFGLRWRTSGSASAVTERLGWRLKLLGYYL
jgi:hypothetical protein